MSLFPAYAEDVDSNKIDYEEGPSGECDSASLAREAQLLASDDDECPPTEIAPPSSDQFQGDDFYLDRKFDPGNLRVSTLYYPGRPRYEAQRRRALGAAAGPARRYWHVRPDEAPDGGGMGPGEKGEGPAAELAARRAAYVRLLAERPLDEPLWLQYLDFLVATVPGYACSWLRLFLVTTVPGCDCSWLRLFLGTTVPGYDCSWLRLFLATIRFRVTTFRVAASLRVLVPAPVAPASHAYRRLSAHARGMRACPLAQLQPARS